MDSKLLEIFIIVADEKSISKASKKLKFAQSNITAKIQKLENSLSCKLFNRIASGVILTLEGEKLYYHATKIVKQMNMAILDMKNSLMQENLKIASTEANAVTKIVNFLIKIHKDFPKIKLELVTRTTQEVKELLNEYKIDIGFINGKPLDDEFEILSEIDEKIVIVQAKKVDIPETLIGFKEGCAYKDFAQKYFYKNTNKEYKTLEFASFETILGCIEAGMGKSILPLSIIKKLNYEDRVKIINLPKHLSHMPTCLICRKNNKPNIYEYLKNLNF